MSTTKSSATRAATAPEREAAAISQVTERLHTRFPHLPAERIQDSVHRHYQALANARIRDYIPVLVERATRNELATQIAHAG
jgi:hypothetical protein